MSKATAVEMGAKSTVKDHLTVGAARFAVRLAKKKGGRDAV